MIQFKLFGGSQVLVCYQVAVRLVPDGNHDAMNPTNKLFWAFERTTARQDQ